MRDPAPSDAPLFDHDAAFFLDLRGMKLRPPAKSASAVSPSSRCRICRSAVREHIPFRQSSVRVDVRVEHAPVDSSYHELPGRKCSPPLNAMCSMKCEPLLVGAFLERTGFHGQSKQHAFRGPGVLADEELEAVWQRAADDRAVEGNRFLWIERPGCGRLREQPPASVTTPKHRK